MVTFASFSASIASYRALACESVILRPEYFDERCTPRGVHYWMVPVVESRAAVFKLECVSEPHSSHMFPFIK